MYEDKLSREFRALRLEQEQAEENRLLDLCVVWKRAKTGETLWVAGGEWDRIDKRYTGREPNGGRIITLRESQIESAERAAWWMQEKKEGRDRDFFGLFMISDRGAGKTHFLSVLGVTLQVEFPEFDSSPSISWLVSSSHTDRDELDREIRDNFPFDGLWYTYVGYPKFQYRFTHGPTMKHISAVKADSLKKGRVDFVLVNEPQKMAKKVPAFGLGRIKDKGGLAVFAGNPPTEQKGKWVLDWEEKYQERRETAKPYPVRFVYLKSSLNDMLDVPVADQVAEVIRDLDPRLAAADIDGLMLRIGQPAYWQWQKSKNLRPMPQVPKDADITRAFLRSKGMIERDYLAGADFQGTPHQAAVFYKVFGTLDAPILWAVDEIVVDQATEEDLLDAVAEANYTPERVLWIGDASGQWQDGKHSKQRDSFRVFKDRRWLIYPPTKPKSADRFARNPPVEQRVKLTNKLLSDARLMVDPDTCPKLAEAFKECELRMGRYGRVVPLGFYAHLTDAASYPLWWACSKSHRPPTGSIGESVDIPRQPAW